jgi:hypothetical protein
LHPEPLTDPDVNLSIRPARATPREGAFRGTRYNLHDLGIAVQRFKRFGRHANVAVTQISYIKTLDSQGIAAMRQLETVVDAFFKNSLPSKSCLTDSIT